MKREGKRKGKRGRDKRGGTEERTREPESGKDSQRKSLREGVGNERGTWTARQGEVSQTQPAGQTDRETESWGVSGLTERQQSREEGG